MSCTCFVKLVASVLGIEDCFFSVGKRFLGVCNLNTRSVLFPLLPVVCGAEVVVIYVYKRILALGCRLNRYVLRLIRDCGNIRAQILVICSKVACYNNFLKSEVVNLSRDNKIILVRLLVAGLVLNNYMICLCIYVTREAQVCVEAACVDI